MIIFYALIGPFLLWPIEYIFPYPHFVEEFFKALLVLFTGKQKPFTYVFAGIVFAFSETVLYSTNINLFGNIGLFFTRFLLTSALHASTLMIIYYFGKSDKKFVWIGFIIAASVHYLYNSLFGRIFF